MLDGGVSLFYPREDQPPTSTCPVASRVTAAGVQWSDHLHRATDDCERPDGVAGAVLGVAGPAEGVGAHFALVVAVGVGVVEGVTIDPKASRPPRPWAPHAKTTGPRRTTGGTASAAPTRPAPTSTAPAQATWLSPDSHRTAATGQDLSVSVDPLTVNRYAYVSPRCRTGRRRRSQSRCRWWPARLSPGGRCAGCGGRRLRR